MVIENNSKKEELLNIARDVISKELALLRDYGISDEEIYKFVNSVTSHYHPDETKRLQDLSDKQDALWREANDF
ncbi:hypothetical protein [Prochlorococcus sp. MIT 1223]|uniref:hypothetical protein n=1 Tax=Prochlorococcus sp. MIT 1223 TaxID=3096217 RepID=UPI002A751252|nr:hypothetical protein [Prochlorococcus sp. MIT 1223]